MSKHSKSAGAMDEGRVKILDALQEISNILGTGLDRVTLSLLYDLTESGVNPDALATLIKELRRQKEADVEEQPSFFS